MTQDRINPKPFFFFLTWQIIISALCSILGVELGLPELTFVFPSGDARCAFSYISALCTFFPGLKCTWNASLLQELASKCIKQWFLSMIKGTFEIENL